MPNLDLVDISDLPQKALIYGGPKSGKSLLVGKLAEAGYNLYWLDGENGASVLKQLPKEAQQRIKLFSIADLKFDINFAKAANEFVAQRNFNVCWEHGKVNCVKCKAQAKSVDVFSFEEILADPKAIVVWDSLTQLVLSFQNHIARNDNFDDYDKIDKDSKREWGHYNAQKLLLEGFLTNIQNSRFKTVVISHELDLDKEKVGNLYAKTTQPVGGTTVQSKQLAKYFSHIVHVRLRNNSHTLISATTSDAGAVAGSRLNIDVSKQGIGSLFSQVGDQVTSTNEGHLIEGEVTEVASEEVTKKTQLSESSARLAAIQKLKNRGK